MSIIIQVPIKNKGILTIDTSLEFGKQFNEEYIKLGLYNVDLRLNKQDRLFKRNESVGNVVMDKQNNFQISYKRSHKRANVPEDKTFLAFSIRLTNIDAETKDNISIIADNLKIKAYEALIIDRMISDDGIVDLGKTYKELKGIYIALDKSNVMHISISDSEIRLHLRMEKMMMSLIENGDESERINKALMRNGFEI